MRLLLSILLFCLFSSTSAQVTTYSIEAESGASRFVGGAVSKLERIDFDLIENKGSVNNPYAGLYSGSVAISVTAEHTTAKSIRLSLSLGVDRLRTRNNIDGVHLNDGQTTEFFPSGGFGYFEAFGMMAVPKIGYVVKVNKISLAVDVGVSALHLYDVKWKGVAVRGGIRYIGVRDDLDHNFDLRAIVQLSIIKEKIKLFGSIGQGMIDYSDRPSEGSNFAVSQFVRVGAGLRM